MKATQLVDTAFSPPPFCYLLIKAIFMPRFILYIVFQILQTKDSELILFAQVFMTFSSQRLIPSFFIFPSQLIQICITFRIPIHLTSF
jgi:hypothetical protein